MTDERAPIGNLFDELADEYISLRKDVGWDPWPHVHAALGRGSLADKKILDLGCASGEVAEILAQRGAHVTGLDASIRMCELAAARVPEMPFFIHDIGEPLPFADDLFDCTLALGCLEFVPDPDVALDEMLRVTRPGGTLLYVEELCGEDCVGGLSQRLDLYETWSRYRRSFEDASDSARGRLRGVSLVRIPGYFEDERQARVIYLRVIGQVGT